MPCIIQVRTHSNFYFIFLLQFFYGSHVDGNKARYIDVLREAVAIKSVSSWAKSRPDVEAMVTWTARKLTELGVQVELADLGKQTLQDGTILPLPKAILGTLGTVSFETSHILFVYIIHLSNTLEYYL